MSSQAPTLRTANWPPVVVCHQLLYAENLGSIGRVMSNFGCQQLILSAPITHDFRGMERTGVKADAVLSSFTIADSLPEALGEVVFALGTSSRPALKRQERLSPEDGVALLFEHSKRGKVALVLGGEKRGLSDDELAHCHAVVAIETSDVQPSMNLAQAAAVLLFLCSRLKRDPVEAGDMPPPGASMQLLARLESLMHETLGMAEFINLQTPKQSVDALLHTLVRNQLSQHEAALWISAFAHLRRHVSPTLQRK